MLSRHFVENVMRIQLLFSVYGRSGRWGQSACVVNTTLPQYKKLGRIFLHLNARPQLYNK